MDICNCAPSGFYSVAEVEQQCCQASLSDVVVLEQLTEGRIAEGRREASPESLPCSRIVAQAEVTANDVLQQPDSARFFDARDHVGEDSANSVEALVGLANVGEADVIEQDLLDNEDGDGLAELAAGLHDSQTQGDDLGAEEERNDLAVVGLLDERADDAERRQSEVFKGSCLGCCVEEWIQEEGYVGCDDERASVACTERRRSRFKLTL